MLKNNNKIAWVEKEEVHKIAPELPTEYTFAEIEAGICVKGYYDALEEHFLEQNFELTDGSLDFVSKKEHGNTVTLRYECMILVLTKRHTYHLTKIGMFYKWINRSSMNDLDKLAFALNYFDKTKVDVDGRPIEDCVKAREYLKEYVDKMRMAGVKNLRQLL